MEEVVLCQPFKPKRVIVYIKCEHEKTKRQCKICNPKAFCHHNKNKTQCKECGGSSICEHNRFKTQCKECGGSSICEHNRKKSTCKECGGGSICQHGKVKSTCKECGGSQICQHNRSKAHCKECSGSQICIHKKFKTFCIECGGGSICCHNRQRSQCKDCGGISICEHGKRKILCKECHGNYICKHNKDKRYCKECDGYALCKTPNCETKKQKKYNNHCLNCFIHLFPEEPVCRNYKTKETATAQFITTNFPNFTWNLDKRIKDGCSEKRPDLMCDLGYQVIIVEVDENQHGTYDCSCENKRIMQLSQDVGHRPLIFIRFNPDAYINSNGEKITSCWGTTPKTGILKIKNNKIDEWNNRLEELKSQIEYWTNDENKTDKTVETIQFFYDENN